MDPAVAQLSLIHIFRALSADVKPAYVPRDQAFCRRHRRLKMAAAQLHDFLLSASLDLPSSVSHIYKIFSATTNKFPCHRPCILKLVMDQLRAFMLSTSFVISSIFYSYKISSTALNQLLRHKRQIILKLAAVQLRNFLLSTSLDLPSSVYTIYQT